MSSHCWPTVKLGEVCDVVSGSTPSSGNTDFWNGSIVWVTPTDLGKLCGFFLADSDRKITQLGLDSCAARLIPTGSVVMSSRAPIGHLAISETILCTNQGCKSFVPGSQVDSLFLFFALKFYVPAIRALGSGATFTEVSKSILEAFRIPLPDLPTQQRIAARLKEQLDEIEQARQAAEEQLRSAGDIQDRFALEILETGNQWPRKPLEELCDIESGQVDPKLPQFACLPHVNGGNIVSGRSRLANVRTAAEDGMTSGKYLFRRGQVLYSKLRPYLRKAVLADFDGVCSADMYPITPRASLLDARFLCQLLISAPFTAYAAEQSERARMPKLNREQLLAWKAPLPDLSTQKKLSARLAAIEEEAHNLESVVREKLAALQKLPAAFLREAFGGIS